MRAWLASANVTDGITTHPAKSSRPIEHMKRFIGNLDGGASLCLLDDNASQRVAVIEYGAVSLKARSARLQDVVWRTEWRATWSATYSDFHLRPRRGPRVN